jgi:hypothetical protein
MLNYEEAKPKPITNADRSRVEETYNWRDDVLEITRRIVHETDEARLSNIANHFEVDLSEIRAFLELTERKMERFTERSIYGSTVYLSTDEQSARQKLAAYEDTGLEPEQITRLLELVREFAKE